MTTLSLTLGEIVFSNFEIPERINFGGTQALAVKKLVGGKRVIDSMGRDDDDITWSGIFFESTAIARAQFLDQMRIQGAELPLSYGAFNYTVVIRDFKPNFERVNQIPYSITVAVVQDLNKPFSQLFPILYNDAINNDLIQANDLLTLINSPAVTTSMASLTAQIASIPSLDNATSQQIASTLSVLTSTQNVVNSTIASLSASIFQ